MNKLESQVLINRLSKYIKNNDSFSFVYWNDIVDIISNMIDDEIEYNVLKNGKTYSTRFNTIQEAEEHIKECVLIDNTAEYIIKRVLVNGYNQVN